jgi:hypothetical protein
MQTPVMEWDPDSTLLQNKRRTPRTATRMGPIFHFVARQAFLLDMSYGISTSTKY